MGYNPCGRQRVRYSGAHVHAHTHPTHRLTPGGACAKNLPANAGDTRNEGLISGSGKSPGGGHGNPLQLAWKIPWTEEHGGLQSMGSQKRWTQLSTHTQRLATFSIRHIIQEVGSPFCHPHKVALQISVWAIKVQRIGDALQTWLRHCKRPSFPLFFLMPQKL